MNKFLCSLVFVLSFSSVYAQSNDSQKEIQTLVQRVDSLEHELSYLRLTYELNTLNSDITMFANEVYTKSIAIQLDLYNRNFNSKLGDAYQQYYETCQRKKQSISELIEAKKTLYLIKVITYPYSESELKTLKASYNVINDAYGSLGKSMELLKIVTIFHSLFDKLWNSEIGVKKEFCHSGVITKNNNHSFSIFPIL